MRTKHQRNRDQGDTNDNDAQKDDNKGRHAQNKSHNIKTTIVLNLVKPNSRDSKNGNKDTRNRYREPDFEFDGIIESEGVLDIMQDGYGF